mgnify:CR=1 FL=1|jgi:hypothetical protein
MAVTTKHSALAQKLVNLAHEFSDQQVGERRSPYMGRGTFISVYKGFIRFERDCYVAGGYYTGSKTYSFGIKVGGAVSGEIHKAIKAKVEALGSEHGVTHFGETRGSAWSFYGFLKKH